jgi:enterobacterial common antigen flippase
MRGRATTPACRFLETCRKSGMSVTERSAAGRLSMRQQGAARPIDSNKILPTVEPGDLISTPDATAKSIVPSMGNAAWRRLLEIDWRVVATIGARLLVIATGIVSSIVTARALRPAGRGEYFLAVTTAQMLAQFTNFGLPSGNTYFVSRDRTLFTGLFANSLWLSFAVVPVVGLVLAALSLSGFIGSSAGHTTLLFSVALAPVILFNLLGSNLFVGLNELGMFNAVQVGGAVLVLPFMLMAGRLHAGPNGFLTASLLGWSVVATVIVVLLRRHAVGALRFRPDIFKMTFSYSTRAYFATLAGFIVLRMNVFILSAIAGTEQVGYYSIASQISDAVAIFPQSIALVLFPRLVSNNRHRARATMENALRTGAVLAVGCVALWFVAPPAIQFAFGPRFLPAVPVVRSMLPGILLVGVTTIISQYLAAGGMPVSVVATWFAGVALTAALGRVLVHRYGAVGAGMTLSVTYGMILIVLTVLAWRMASARRSALRLTMPTAR